MATTTSPDSVRGTSVVAERIEAWAGRSDISARSVLVTVLGDAIAPLGGSVWLADLFELMAPFGFSERLVRTSLSRIVAEGWVASERTGRRSRYVLTAEGDDEFMRAEARIYHRPRPSWDGEWTLVFLGEADPDAELIRRLGWRGFAQLTDGVFAAPNADPAGTRDLVDRFDVTAPPLIASARFDQLGPLGASGPFRDSSGLSGAEDAYRRVVDDHRWLADLPLEALDGPHAFAVRTMIVHDLRRARLRDPDLPPELLPPDWVGTTAHRLAEATYRAVAAASWAWAAAVTGLTPGAIATTRFPTGDSDHSQELDQPDRTDDEVDP